jgi:hypothetical protein
VRHWLPLLSVWPGDPSRSNLYFVFLSSSTRDTQSASRAVTECSTRWRPRGKKSANSVQVTFCALRRLVRELLSSVVRAFGTERGGDTMAKALNPANEAFLDCENADRARKLALHATLQRTAPLRFGPRYSRQVFEHPMAGPEEAHAHGAWAGRRTRPRRILRRVSTSAQSGEAQLFAVRQCASTRGLEVAGEFVDAGVSVGKDRRPALDKLLADARRRRFDVLAITKLDRLARSMRHLTILVTSPSRSRCR